MAIVRTLSDQRRRAGSSGAGRPRGTSPTSATPCAPRSNSGRREQAARRRGRARPGRGRREAQAEDHAQRDDADEERRPVHVVERPRSTSPSSRQALSPSDEVPVSFGSSPMTTSIAAPARNPVITAFDRNCAIHPIRSTASSRNSTPGRERDRGDQLRGLRPAEAGDAAPRRRRRRPARSSARSRLPGACRTARR